MSGVHLHLILTHIPVLGTAFGILILGYAWMTKKTEAARISMGLFVLSALAAVGTYLTGEAAEHAVEGLAGVSETILEQHEEAAVVALVATIVLGVASAVGLYLSRKNASRRLMSSLFLVALIVGGILAWTSNLGGQINHPEIRSDAVVQTVPVGDEAHENE